MKSTSRSEKNDVSHLLRSLVRNLPVQAGLVPLVKQSQNALLGRVMLALPLGEVASLLRCVRFDGDKTTQGTT